MHTENLSTIPGNKPAGAPSMKVRFVQIDPEKVATRAKRFDGLSRVACTAVALGCFLVPLRGTSLGFTYESVWSPASDWPVILISAGYDLLLLTIAAAAATGVLLWLRQSNQPVYRSRVVCHAFNAFALVMLLAAIANVGLLRWTGKPMRVGHLVHAPSMTALNILVALGLCVAMMFLSLWLRKAMLATAHKVPPENIALALLPVLAFDLFISHWYLTSQKWGWDKTSTPLVSLVDSIVLHPDVPLDITNK